MRHLTHLFIANIESEIRKVLRTGALPATFAPARLPLLPTDALRSISHPAHVPAVRDKTSPYVPASLPRVRVDLPAAVPELPVSKSGPGAHAPAMNAGGFSALLRAPGAVDPSKPYGHERK
jgi:hypothetical protein